MIEVIARDKIKNRAVSSPETYAPLYNESNSNLHIASKIGIITSGSVMILISQSNRVFVIVKKQQCDGEFKVVIRSGPRKISLAASTIILARCVRHERFASPHQKKSKFEVIS